MAAVASTDDLVHVHDALQANPGGLNNGSEALDDAAPAFIAAARSALTMGLSQDALALGKAAVALAPDNARAWSVVGDALWQLKQPLEARRALEHAVSLDDKDLTAAIACARAQAATHAPAAARALLSFVLMRARSEDIRQAAQTVLMGLVGGAA